MTELKKTPVYQATYTFTRLKSHMTNNYSQFGYTYSG